MVSHESAEAYYDHLDDVGVHTAAEIRQMSGYEPTHGNEEFTADAIRARLGLAESGAEQHGVEIEEETPIELHDGSNPKHGLDKQSWARTLRNPEQREITLSGLALARKHLADSRRNHGE